MGNKHANKDKIIYRKELLEIEKNINGHTFAWTKMWDTGGEHGHMGRVIDAKITHSENVSTMYVVYKDHKQTPGESRPIVTGCSGNTMGLSNSVSNFLESVANSIENHFECISSEDMLASTKRANEKIDKIIKEWKEKRLKKLRCKSCAYKEIKIQPCQECHEDEEIWNDKDDDDDKLLKKMEQKYDCDTCGLEWRDMMETDCDCCGEGLFWEDQEICLLGLDVVALFPSMKSKETGLIIRHQVLKSPIKVEGFDWKQGARYIVVNRSLTGDLKCLWNVLPWRRKVGGTAPGMKSAEVNSKTGNVEFQWQFPRAVPTPSQIREIQARCAEIATRFIFENFCYKFSGNTYQQSSGGPGGNYWSLQESTLLEIMHMCMCACCHIP